tara:strand:+ start:73 stop:1104 length:1032 start_codon:yes stop_codon:yes gene_type:complete
MRLLFVFVLFSSFSLSQRAIVNINEELKEPDKIIDFQDGYDLGEILQKKIIFPPLSEILKKSFSNIEFLKCIRNEVFEHWSGDKFYSTSLEFMWEIGCYDDEYITAIEYLEKNNLNNKKIRQEIFNYMLDTYKNLSKEYPISTKKEILFVLNDLIEFLNNYSKNEAHYKSIDKIEKEIIKKTKDSYNNYKMKKITWEQHSKYRNKLNENVLKIGGYDSELGFNRSWLYRRIEYQNVPPEELKKYISSLSKIIEKEISENNSNWDCYKKLTINNELTIFYDGMNIQVIGENGKKIIFKGQQKIKISLKDINMLPETLPYKYIISYEDGENKIKKTYDSDLNEIN